MSRNSISSPTRGSPTRGTPTNASIIRENMTPIICIEFMIRFLQRTPDAPNIINPLTNRSLSEFANNNVFQQALNVCNGNSYDLINSAIVAITSEINEADAWSEVAIARHYGTYPLFRQELAQRRETLLTDLRNLQAEMNTATPTTPTTPVAANRTPTSPIRQYTPHTPVVARQTQARPFPQYETQVRPVPVGRNLGAEFEINADENRMIRFYSYSTQAQLEADTDYMALDADVRPIILAEWIQRHNTQNINNSSITSATVKKRSTISSNSVKSAQMQQESESVKKIYEMCSTKFEKLDLKNEVYKTAHGKPIKRMINKYIKVCHKIVDPDRCYLNNLPKIIPKLKKKYLTTLNDTILIDNVIDGDELMYLYTDYNHNLIKYKIDILKINLESYRIRYQDQEGIDAGGLRRQFAQNVAEQLFTYGNIWKTNSKSPKIEDQGGIFVEFEEKTNIYKFNTNINLNYFIYAGQSASKADIFMFAGKVYAWLMANGIKCQNRLSKAILINLLYKELPEDKANKENTEITIDDYGIILLSESPTYSKSYIDILEIIKNSLPNSENKSLEDILADPYNIYLEFPNDASKEITFTNFRDFLGVTGKYKLLGPDHSYIDAFKKGFFVKSGWMKNMGFNIPMLDYLTYSLEINDEVIKTLINEVKIYSNNTITYSNALLALFTGILENKNNNKATIYESVLEEAKKRTQGAIESGQLTQLQYDANTPHTYEEFISKLLKFWGGSYSYYNNPIYKYRINFIEYGSTIKSHTCFFTLDIPIYTKYMPEPKDKEVRFAKKNELFTELIVCIILSGNTFDMA